LNTLEISQADIAAAFTEVFGRPPDDNNLGMLLRLPGMVAVDSPNDERRFVDADFASVAAAGDVYEFILASKAGAGPFESCSINIDTLGSEFVTRKLARNGNQEALIIVALENLSDPVRFSTLKGDLVVALSATNLSPREKWISISEASVGTLDLQHAPEVFSKIKFYDSIFDIVEIDEGHTASLPEFHSSMISIIRGPRDEAGISRYFHNTEIGRFEFEEITNNSILELSIPSGVKLGLTVLRKLYVQPGGGRLESAFSRGIKPEHRPMIDAVLDTIVSEGFARISRRGGEPVYLKNVDRLVEAREIVLKKGAVKSSLISELQKLA
jgi:hypothetical protein